MNNISATLQASLSFVSINTGRLVSWLTFLMVILLSFNVLSSWLFQSSSIVISELITWMHSANFLLAGAYTLNRNEHVRVDIFYAKMSFKAKGGARSFGLKHTLNASDEVIPLFI